ncbi:hypothetical protein AB7M45_008535 [Bradyrhizobium elkanii]
MRAVGVHVVIAQHAHIATVDDRALRVFAFERVAAAVPEKLRLILPRGRRLRRVLVDPFPAFGEAIGRQRRVRLDLVVEIDARLDARILDRGVRLGIGGACRKPEEGEHAGKTHDADRRHRASGAHGKLLKGEGMRQRYSAAALWPSRALSLWISSSAASEITVPGGKIASAPAAYSAS